MTTGFFLLALTAASLAFVHTVLGPDHYLPLALAGRANGWSMRRTLALTLLSGCAHLLGSVVLGGIGVALGVAVAGMQVAEGLRGGFASWLLLGMGLCYAAWGVRHALRSKEHVHWHAHNDGTVHRHVHNHRGGHAHAHGDLTTLSSWGIFLVFLLGPCETLVPLLMVPASKAQWLTALVVVAVFSVVTLSTMALAVWACLSGLERIRLGPWERFSHAVAGGLIALSAVGMLVFGL